MYCLIEDNVQQIGLTYYLGVVYGVLLHIVDRKIYIMLLIVVQASASGVVKCKTYSHAPHSKQ